MQLLKYEAFLLSCIVWGKSRTRLGFQQLARENEVDEDLIWG